MLRKKAFVLSLFTKCNRKAWAEQSGFCCCPYPTLSICFIPQLSLRLPSNHAGFISHWDFKDGSNHLCCLLMWRECGLILIFLVLTSTGVSRGVSLGWCYNKGQIQHFSTLSPLTSSSPFVPWPKTMAREEPPWSPRRRAGLKTMILEWRKWHFDIVLQNLKSH